MVACDVVVIGGGIVGLASAMELLARCPDLKLVVLEKELQIAWHQTGHNSGVIHSGIYYRPGSLKAHTCVTGARLLVEFCQTHRIPHQLCGKLVVATEESELPALKRLYERGVANGVPGLALVGPERLRELEPHARGVAALHVGSAGVVDYVAVAQVFAELIRRRGGTVQTATRLMRCVREASSWRLETTAGQFRSTYLITCAGLHADRVARQAGAGKTLTIAPFRGEYYDLISPRCALVNTMIYPVPHPALPFLGVHFTRSISGGVHAGPNAVLALKREGYQKTDVSVRDTMELLSFPGFWNMARRYWRVGLEEAYRSWSKAAFVRALQRLVPEVQAEDLVPGGCGVRAQAIDARGHLLDDFNLVPRDHALHVRNVPSPAATASIRIGQLIADEVAAAFRR